MTTKDVVGKAVEVVVFILAAFSGFLERIAPPDETGTAFAVGIASFAMLVILLIIMALAKGRQRATRKKYWIASAALSLLIFITFAYIYNGDRGRLTFLFPPEEESQELYVGGGEDNLTPAAREAKSRRPDLTPAQLVSGFGGLPNRTAVWPAEAINMASTKLKVDYVLMVIFLGTAIFCVTEGILLRD